MASHFKQRLLELLYPELRQLSLHNHQWALQRAKSEPMNNAEHLAILLAVVATTYFTRHIVADVAGATRTIAILANFVVAIPILALLVGPFLIRRTRRGLRGLLAERSQDGRTP